MKDRDAHDRNQSSPDPGVTASAPASHSSRSRANPDRFTPGTMLGTRFRIVARLGSGGMGEVFRADDLELGHPVALKLLPVHLSSDAAALARLRDEVRLARQVAHPNVCRVYDIGEADRQYFVSMEYVDGEDLGSALRRMGRPSVEKALQIARQLCAGLHAAHECGILHRDLKPANIMIDGRGRVRVTDFGLASLTQELVPLDTRAGTPAYMAPEQLAGKEVSPRSDIYALGLVLYEIFTGKRAFDAATVAELRRLREDSTPPTPSSVVSDLDPVVERVILHCLEPEPRHRPASALAVAKALPGGDPLAAALAAGETPSPELLAASGETGALRPSAALALLCATLAGFLLVAKLNDFGALYRLSPFSKPPEVLAERAHEILYRLGYDDPAVDQAYGFYVNDLQLAQLAREAPPDAWKKRLADMQPAPIGFWYRQGPVQMLPWLAGEQISPGDPPLTIAQMARLWLDARGRLMGFNYVPPQVHEGPRLETKVNWESVFEESGLVFSDFQLVDPAWTPLVYADQRHAWTGTYPNQPDVPVRVEGASFEGRLVYYLLVMPYTQPSRMPYLGNRGLSAVVAEWLSVSIVIAAIGAGSYVAHRNSQMGRGDRRGAFRVAALIFALGMASWLMGGHHAAGQAQFNLFVRATGRNLFTAVWLWLMYMALEPSARRHWPETLIAWSRAIGGRIKDPLVGKTVLIGMTTGVGLVLLDRGTLLLSAWLGDPIANLHGASAVGGSESLMKVLAMLLGDVDFLFAPILALFLIVLIQMVVRKRMLAVVIGLFVCAILPNLLRKLPSTHGITSSMVILQTAAPYIVGVVLLVRFGLPALMAMIFTDDRLDGFPLTLDSTAWYSGTSLLVLVLLAGFAVWAYRCSLGAAAVYRYGGQESKQA